MKKSVKSEEEISQTLLNLIAAYEQSDVATIQKCFSRNIDIHVHELDLYGPDAFLKLYQPEKLTLSEFSVQTSGDVGWGYGTFTRKTMVMHFSAVFQEKKRHEWKLVHLHLSDASL